MSGRELALPPALHMRPRPFRCEQPGTPANSEQTPQTSCAIRRVAAFGRVAFGRDPSGFLRASTNGSQAGSKPPDPAFARGKASQATYTCEQLTCSCQDRQVALASDTGDP